MNAIEMIRRCAKHQPHNPPAGVAAWSGEHVDARSDWGVLHTDGDITVVMPALKLLRDNYLEIPQHVLDEWRQAFMRLYVPGQPLSIPVLYTEE